MEALAFDWTETVGRLTILAWVAAFGTLALVAYVRYRWQNGA